MEPVLENVLLFRLKSLKRQERTTNTEKKSELTQIAEYISRKRIGLYYNVIIIY